MKASVVLVIGLMLIGLGTALVFVGVLTPGVFYPGVYLIAIGGLVVAVAGVIAIAVKSKAEAA